MDANKRDELLSIGYTIRGTCGMCKHGQFNHNNFGTCAIHDYQHLKHTGDKRQLSIYIHGRCPKFVIDAEVQTRTAHYGEFM